MALKLYPLGIQTFERIRKENKLYIDKTEYVYRLTHTSGTYFFLGRPRRFGKSLFLTTLQSYFEGKKDLFNGLAIEKLEKEWTEYPVLHFDLSGGKHMNKEQLERYLAFILETEEKIWGITQPQIDANNRLTELINTAYEKSGKQVVVLIDEYDAPMLDVAHEKEQLDTLRNIMRNFFSPLKYSEAKLRFVFLTGITKFSQVSIFSELNNITNISMNDDYAGICGITKEELLIQMSEDIEELARRRNITKEQVIDKLKENYDGYHFSRRNMVDVFNPFSLINALADSDLKNYWASSGATSLLPKFVDDMEIKLGNFDPCAILRQTIETSDVTGGGAELFLYQSGYLTIKDYQMGVYILGFPNSEVRQALYETVLPALTLRSNGDIQSTQSGLFLALQLGNLPEAMKCLKALIADVPYSNKKLASMDMEERYRLIMSTIFNAIGCRVEVEKMIATGRIDMVVETTNFIYVLELKLSNNGGISAAENQMKEKSYTEPFKADKRKVIALAVELDETGKGLIDWKEVDESL